MSFFIHRYEDHLVWWSLILCLANNIHVSSCNFLMLRQPDLNKLKFSATSRWTTSCERPQTQTGGNIEYHSNNCYTSNHWTGEMSERKCVKCSSLYSSIKNSLVKICALSRLIKDRSAVKQSVQKLCMPIVFIVCPYHQISKENITVCAV